MAAGAHPGEQQVLGAVDPVPVPLHHAQPQESRQVAVTHLVAHGVAHDRGDSEELQPAGAPRFALRWRPRRPDR